MKWHQAVGITEEVHTLHERALVLRNTYIACLSAVRTQIEEKVYSTNESNVFCWELITGMCLVQLAVRMCCLIRHSCRRKLFLSYLISSSLSLHFLCLFLSCFFPIPFVYPSYFYFITMILGCVLFCSSLTFLKIERQMWNKWIVCRGAYEGEDGVFAAEISVSGVKWILLAQRIRDYKWSALHQKSVFCGDYAVAQTVNGHAVAQAVSVVSVSLL